MRRIERRQVENAPACSSSSPSEDQPRHATGCRLDGTPWSMHFDKGDVRILVSDHQGDEPNFRNRCRVNRRANQRESNSPDCIQAIFIMLSLRAMQASMQALQD